MALQVPQRVPGYRRRTRPGTGPTRCVDFVRGAGRDKVLFGTNFPTVGHRQALEQLPELGLDALDHRGRCSVATPAACSRDWSAP